MKLQTGNQAVGVEFWFESGSGRVPIDRWALAVSEQPKARSAVESLLQLAETEVAQESAQDSLIVPHAAIAKLSDAQAERLRLPPGIPYNLSIRGEGIITDPGFRFRWWFVRLGGQPIVLHKVGGAFVAVGATEYRLPDPLYTLIAMLEAYNATPPHDTSARLVRWGEIWEWLPEDAIVEEQLREMRIARAAAFSLEIELDESREVTFHPVLLRAATNVKGPASAQAEAEMLQGFSTELERALPSEYQRTFAQQFRRFRNARATYPLGAGHYVVMSEPLRTALSVVRAKQDASLDERRRFIANPYAVIREEIGDELAQMMATPMEEDVDEAIDRLFCETKGYSDRVIDIGVWQPKQLPWIRQPAQTWLPPEEFGIPVGDHVVFVKKENVEAVRRLMQEALKTGLPSVSFNGVSLPADQGVLDALDGIIGMVSPIRGEANGAPGYQEAEVAAPVNSPDRVVLRIVDNLNVVGYRPERQPHDAPLTRVPRTLKSTLKRHQLECLDWLKLHWKTGSPGVLLADDMGLGKTLQALTFIAWVQEEMRSGSIPAAPCLVVAPTGLLKNWQDEHELHFSPPGLGTPLLAYGASLRRLKAFSGRSSEISDGKEVLDRRKLLSAAWVLTTYETLRDYQHSFGKVRWAVMVFDEAQKIKTPGALVTEAAKAMYAEFTLMMTGTPVENRLADLWCIVDTALPGELGDLKSFSRVYESPNGDHSEVLKSLKSRLEHTSDDHKIPKPMLRRVKADHVDGLPPKKENVLQADMPVEQARQYQTAIDSARSAKSNIRGAMLEALHRLRSISLHPFLKTESMSDEDYIQASARLAPMFEQLDRIAQDGEKSLIFVESLDMQSVLQSIIQRRYRMTTRPLIINGAINGEKRKNRVDLFQRRYGFDVMLLSPKAGGVGLTLTAANHVFHLSRWWNPAVEDQCSDRAYRIGQTRPVHIYYMIAKHPVYPGRSFDERLHQLLDEKRKLSRALLAPPSVTDRDVGRLFREAVQLSLDAENGLQSDLENADFDEIDSMESSEFEKWVLSKLREAGHRVAATPRSHDGGADGLATATLKKGRNWLIQCKHLQTNRPCGADAVREIVAAMPRYRHHVNGALAPVVVTNAPIFTPDAIELADKVGVRLVARDELLTWHLT